MASRKSATKGNRPAAEPALSALPVTGSAAEVGVTVTAETAVGLAVAVLEGKGVAVTAIVAVLVAVLAVGVLVAVFTAVAIILLAHMARGIYPPRAAKGRPTRRSAPSTPTGTSCSNRFLIRFDRPPDTILPLPGASQSCESGLPALAARQAPPLAHLLDNKASKNRACTSPFLQGRQSGADRRLSAPLADCLLTYGAISTWQERGL